MERGLAPTPILDGSDMEEARAQGIETEIKAHRKRAARIFFMFLIYSIVKVYKNCVK